MYITGEYDILNNIYLFNIESDMRLDEEDYLNITNGSASLNTKLIDLTSSCLLYVYTTDTSVTDSTKFLYNEIYGSKSHVVFSKESIILEFGKPVKNIWNRMYNTYTTRKYKTYSFDYVKRYEEDVYEVYSDGSIFKKVIIDGKEELVSNILHYKGDVVTDGDGNPVYEHKKGDVILDSNDNPIIDVKAGIQRYIDILMLEHEFRVADASPYKEYHFTCLDILENYLFINMEEYNKTLIDNTHMVYKSLKSSTDVIFLNSSVPYTGNYLISPEVMLYLNTSTEPTSQELNNYRDTVGKIIDSYLDKNVIYLIDIKNEIMSRLGSSVVSVKITGLDTVNNSEVISIDKTSNKLVMNKLLEINTTNTLEVKYDVKISYTLI